MSKLSPSLKALINSPASRPGTVPAPAQITTVFERIANDAAGKGISLPVWLSFSTATTVTMNSPESMLRLHELATRLHPTESVYAAELMREIGVKCIGFNGIPRSINCLNAFYAGLSSNVKKELTTKPTRSLNPDNISDAIARGHSLWKAIYTPFDEKLTAKLFQSHPDLLTYIMECGYGCLFSDLPSQPKPAVVGRVLTSIVAIACLRAQTGTGPQLISHVFGLRKAFQNDIVAREDEKTIRGADWLASDEGNIWLLETVDSIVETIGLGEGSSFAPAGPRVSKL